MPRLPRIATCQAGLALIAAFAIAGCAGFDGRSARSQLLGAVVRGFAGVRDAERYVDPCQSAGSKSVHCPGNFGAMTAYADASPAHWEATAERERRERADAYQRALQRFLDEKDRGPAAGQGSLSFDPVRALSTEPPSLEYGQASYPGGTAERSGR